MKNKLFDSNETEKIRQKSKEVLTKLSQQDFLNSYILETLESFGFRFFDEPQSPIQINQNTTIITSTEKGIKEAIKNKNPLLRAGISELVKRVSREQGPTILRQISVIVLRDGKQQGTCQAVARISFGHPAHDFSKGSFLEKISEFKFEDEIHFRNTLAKHLELACELF